ncbi:hypothetical protein PhCBS80983_g05093 [Powellomyces hirtus]|uniref:Arrestin-like N-terminal domain-containing protein n=1 Tax=Powellomyces hirtus TaxID=109895 RepID=A0A507DVD0_9FUNG|nr:hypothetical protein PhCBS80983_g05093 [Powellomyces hirtus]
MSVPFTQWTMSVPSQLPAAIDVYDIVLDKPEVVLEDDETASGPFSKLEGVVRLHLNEPLPGVRAISFRFVAGAVAKFDDPEYNANLRGPERLFDRTINLWDVEDPENTSRILPVAYHEFRFALKIPGHMPPSLRYPRGQVQYMLVAAIEWENTICGLNLPFWSWSPITTKKEVPVRKIPGKIECVIKKLKDMETDEKRVRVLQDGEETLAVPSSTGKTVWSPVPEIEISIPTRHPTTGNVVPVMIDTTDNATITSFKWTLRQHASFSYMYNITLRGPVDSPHNAISPRKREEKFILKNTHVYRPETGEEKSSSHHGLLIPLLNDNPLPEAELIEDLDTTVMTIRHYAKLQVTYRLNTTPTASGSAADGKDDTEAEIELPIVLYVLPSSAPSDAQRDNAIEAPIAAAAQPVDLPPTSEEPPAYVETSSPPMYEEEGVRRRRA